MHTGGGVKEGSDWRQLYSCYAVGLLLHLLISVFIEQSLLISQ